MSTKTCIHCGKVKPVEEFVKCNQKADGRDSACKICRREVVRKNAERRRAIREKEGNPLLGKCSKCGLTQSFDSFYPAKNLGGRSSWCKKCLSKHYSSNKDKYRERARRWRAAHPIERRLKAKRDNEAKRKSLMWHIERKILRKMDRYAKHGISRLARTATENTLGYTFAQLRAYIESKFTEAMTWDLLMDGKIEIDHVIPRSSFYYESVHDQDFKDCWALSNMQPLWKKDNRAKSDKMPDGRSGAKIGKLKQAKRRILEESWVAGYEPVPTSEEDVLA